MFIYNCKMKVELEDNRLAHLSNVHNGNLTLELCFIKGLFL